MNILKFQEIQLIFGPIPPVFYGKNHAIRVLLKKFFSKKLYFKKKLRFAQTKFQYDSLKKPKEPINYIFYGKTPKIRVLLKFFF